MKRRYFIAGTDTGVGKTSLTEALILAAREDGIDAIGLKPIETGCPEGAEPEDARILAEASDAPALASFDGFYRAKAPLAPYGATLEGESAPPPLSALIAAISRAEAGRSMSLIEGAGGILVPYSREHTMADLVRLLDAELILVAADRLGTLSSTLTAVEAAEHRGIKPLAIVLSGVAEPDLSARTNAQILRDLLPEQRIFTLPYAPAREERKKHAKNLLNALLGS